MFRFAQRMLARLPELSRAAVERCAAEVPFYRDLPRESLDGEVSGAFTASIRLVATTLREDRAPDAAELTEVIDWSARRAADGLPLDAALSAYLTGSLACWERLAADATPAELRRYGAHALRYLATVLPAVALAHLHEQQQLEGQRRDMRHTLISALLAGEPSDELAKQSGVTLAPAYLVLLLALEPRPSDPRQTVRRVQAALDAHQQADVLASLTTGGGTVLLPAPPTGPEGLPELLARIADATSRPVTAAVATAPERSAVPGALEEARAVADLVGRLSRPPGLYRLDDVLLEYQLARPGRALAGLAAKLDPLDARPDLLTTVEAFVRHGHNRSRASAELSIHRNTLDYRLARIAKLTGLDLASPEGLRLLDAAVTARALG
ncbi:PucR family transcriptional regulator [Actinomadura kijaniata]|uniref:PucR family transcriptional regulator n=1 Tax=Actinomadura kijaniata TaxID=46161 RepID=UPI0008294FA8|nr:helix-turn-helix domain-containing protein [Actinomadura kijaniata]